VALTMAQALTPTVLRDRAARFGLGL
jgi:hypothetical protein